MISLTGIQHLIVFSGSRQNKSLGWPDVMIPERLRNAHWSGYEKAIELGVTKHSGKSMLTKATHQSDSAVYVEMSFAVVTDSGLGTQGLLQ